MYNDGYALLGKDTDEKPQAPKCNNEKKLTWAQGWVKVHLSEKTLGRLRVLTVAGRAQSTHSLKDAKGSSKEKYG